MELAFEHFLVMRIMWQSVDSVLLYKIEQACWVYWSFQLVECNNLLRYKKYLVAIGLSWEGNDY